MALAQRTSKREKGVVVFGAIFALFGAYSLVAMVLSQRQAAASVYWPKVDGIIRESRVQSIDASAKRKDCCRAKIVYEYLVDGKSYQSSKKSFSLWADKRSKLGAEDELRLHPLGSAVVVTYDPADPSNGVLQPGVQHSFASVIWFPVLVLLIGLSIARAGWRASDSD